MLPMSAVSDEGVMTVKIEACDQLLAQRVEIKMKGRKAKDVMNRLHVAIPIQRDQKERPPCIPQVKSAAGPSLVVLYSAANNMLQYDRGLSLLSVVFRQAEVCMYVNYKIPRGPSDVRIAFLVLLKQRSPIKLPPLELVTAVTSWLCHLAVKT